MKKEFSKTYDPKKYEDAIYEKWEKSGMFNPDNLKVDLDAVNYSNILPPPNANGELHIGHASGYVVMDLLGRYHRMLGERTMLLPGKDHAGIQTQVVYEKKIKKERGVSRYDLGREKFYEEIFDFCIDRSGYMRKQEKKIGLSADWSREKFTLDPKIMSTVLETFVKMYNEVDEKGNRMVYRGERIINWCPRCASALSDMEVEHHEKKGKLYWIKYGPFVLATARPETKLGDTAVAVHPDDDRYKDMIGKEYSIPGVLGEFKVRVVADKEVDMEFGSGAIKVTPAHSFVDNEIAQRHNLASKKIIDEEGKMMDNCGKYAGMTTIEAREAIVADMEKMGLIDHVEEDYQHSLSVCERCKSTIEPLPSEQWFVNVDHENFSLKKKAREAIANDEIKIYPARFKKIMLNWIDNVHDWCISRQIWWGPRIPAWYKEGEIKVQVESPGADWKQDEDTFDTWFSSGQWAYSTLDFPKGKDYEDYFPSENMIMGRDILPLWSFRMIILSLYRTGKIPFRNLYFTGLVRDEKGQKMSKSKGNGIEPLEMIEKYGTDAVRLSLLVGSSAGNDMNLGEAKIAGYRNMVNKLWNVARYINSIVDENKDEDGESFDDESLTMADIWIVRKMNDLINEVGQNIESYEFSAAGIKLQNFMWDDLADWYVEVSKFENNKNIKKRLLRTILIDLLKMWHPFVPFVSEAIWERMGNKMLMIESWPKRDFYFKFLQDNLPDRPMEEDDDFFRFDEIQKIIVSVRNARAEYGIVPSKKIRLIIEAGDNEELIRSQKALIKNLKTGIGKLEIKKRVGKISKAYQDSIGNLKLFIPFEGIIDLKKEKKRIKEKIEFLKRGIEIGQKKLKNKTFFQNAPFEVVKKEKEKVGTMNKQMKSFEKQLKNLDG